MAITTLLSLNSSLLWYFCLFFIITSHFINAESSLEIFSCDQDSNNNFLQNHQNIRALLSNLSFHTEIGHGFYNFSSETISAVGLCRGDVDSRDCRTCLRNSSVLLMQHCPGLDKGQATVWVDGCMIRYSTTRDIFGVVDTSFSQNSCNGNDSIVKESSEEFIHLLDQVKTQAATGDSKLKFATMNDAQSRYVLAQCTPDLSKEDCNQCLDLLIPEFGRRCSDKELGYAVSPSCNIRFDTYHFYADTPRPAPNMPSPSLSPPLPVNGSPNMSSPNLPPPPPVSQNRSSPSLPPPSPGKVPPYGPSPPLSPRPPGKVPPYKPSPPLPHSPPREVPPNRPPPPFPPPPAGKAVPPYKPSPPLPHSPPREVPSSRPSRGLPPPPPKNNKGRKFPLAVAIAVPVTASLGVTFVVTLAFFRLRRRRKSTTDQEPRKSSTDRLDRFVAFSELFMWCAERLCCCC